MYLGPLNVLYPSPPGRPVTLPFTPWQTCYFTLHPLADLLLYPSPPGRPVTLPFTPWQTCYFTLHPLADLLLYPSPPGRPVTLPFTPWQTCSFQYQLDCYGKHSAMLQLLREGYSFTYIPYCQWPSIHLHRQLGVKEIHGVISQHLWLTKIVSKLMQEGVNFKI